MMDLSLGAVRTQIAAETFRSDVRAFQRAQRRQMAKAASVVRKDVQTEVETVFPPSATRRQRTKAGKKLGPLRSNIRARIFYTATDVIALIRPKAAAFYGRFQETGLNVMRKGRIIAQEIKKRRGKHKNIRADEKPFRLPRRPFLEPVARRIADKVARILGDAYDAFYSGGGGA